MGRLPVLLAAAIVGLVPGTAVGAAVPSLRAEGPAEVAQGESFTVTVVLENAGDSDGTISFVDIETPVTGPDGKTSTPEDGIELLSAGFANTVSRGSDFTFDALGRVLHPLLVVDGRPEVVEGKPGNLLWVSFDQLNQIAFAGSEGRLDAEFRMGKRARPGQRLKLQFRGGFLRGSQTGGPVVSREVTVRVTPTAVTLEEAAAGLASDPVYVAPSADAELSSADETRLEILVQGAKTPIFLAVLPSTAGAPQSVLERLVDAAGVGGTFAVLVGDRYRAVSDRFAADELAGALQEAGAEVPGAAPADVLAAFVQEVGRLAQPVSSSEPPTQADRDEADGAPVAGTGGSSSPPWGWIVFGGIAGVILAWLMARSAQRTLRASRRRERLVAELRENAEDELTALGVEIAELDLDVELPGTDAGAKDDYSQAVGVYDEARDELPRASSPEELERVAASIRAGREAMARAKERLARQA